jgi:phosphoglycerol transferase MdoB-like AlkP superfamily enzyme
METLLYLFVIPIIIIGIRGGLDESTTNVGQVYYSQKQFLNHSAVNPVFSFLSSLERTASYIPDYEFMDNSTCEKLVDSLYPTESFSVDTLLNTNRPNIIVILMESCGAIFTGLEGRADVMPQLERLMNEGISFDSCYANSWRTDRGTVCTYSGYPSFPVSSVMKMPSKSRLLPGLAKSFAAEGYETSYFYGGDINFTNMRSYLIGTGFQQITWKKDFSSEEQQTAEWGVRDDIMFSTVSRQATDYQAKGKSFIIGFSTLSSHEPWDVPLKKFDDEVLNAFYYLDHCIGVFVDSLKKTPVWKDLLIVLLPDHGIDYKEVDAEDSRHDHIPMVWTGGAVKAARRIKSICNQTDLPATLLGQMGINHTDYRYSRDVMSSNYTCRMAVHTYNNGIAMVDSTGRAMYDLTSNRMIQGDGYNAERLIHIGKAVLQSAATNLKGLK